MSLINEALKRAQEDQPAKRPDDGLGDLQPAAAAAPRRKRPRFAGRRKNWILLPLLMAMVGTGAWAVYDNVLRDRLPRRAGASPAPQLEWAAREEPGAGPPDTVLSSAARRVASRAAGESAPGPETSDELLGGSPPPPESGWSKLGFEALASIARGFQAVSSPDPDKDPDAPVTSAAEEESPDEAPPASDRPTRRRARYIPPGRYRVDGIMAGAFDATAILNGTVVRVGDEIDGARVIEIGSNRVVLNADGQRVVLHMKTR